jgi:hypothetical protein
VTLGGATETGLSAVGGTINFLVGGAALSADPGEAWVYRNGSRVPAAQVQLLSNGIGVTNVLTDGRNDLELEALDSNGYLVYDVRTVWAGSRTLTVTVRNAANQAVTGATVTASLNDYRLKGGRLRARLKVAPRANVPGRCGSRSRGALRAPGSSGS